MSNKTKTPREMAEEWAEIWLVDTWQPRLRAERSGTAPWGQLTTVQDASKDGYLAGLKAGAKMGWEAAKKEYESKRHPFVQFMTYETWWASVNKEGEKSST